MFYPWFEDGSSKSVAYGPSIGGHYFNLDIFLKGSFDKNIFLIDGIYLPKDKYSRIFNSIARISSLRKSLDGISFVLTKDRSSYSEDAEWSDVKDVLRNISSDFEIGGGYYLEDTKLNKVKGCRGMARYFSIKVEWTPSLYLIVALND
ncbi:hypothetical protein KAS08_05935 [Candidatus Pacearchaeota archaeon]|nr:hypothetical protein [Candidatus Pacearchaeota archaeon]